MKLRVQGNSLRIRFTRSEVAALTDGRSVSQTTRFSPFARLMTCVQVSADAADLSASFTNSDLVVVLPRKRVHDWAQSNEVSISAAQAIAGHESLLLLIEKDFECLHCDVASAADMFPNPRRQDA